MANRNVKKVKTWIEEAKGTDTEQLRLEVLKKSYPKSFTKAAKLVKNG